MADNYELSRSDLLSWINALTRTPVAKLEQLGAGYTYCELLEVACPGKVPLSKVHWRAKSEYEFINNFKLLQQSFLKIGVQRNIDINRMVKCKYQDNFEFLQWFKRTFDELTLQSKEGIENRKREVCSARQHARGPLALIHNISVIPAGNTSQIDSTKQTKRINNSSFEEVLGELSVAFQNNGSKLKIFGGREQREYYSKLLDNIQLVVSRHEANQTSESLAEALEHFLLQPPPVVEDTEPQI